MSKIKAADEVVVTETVETGVVAADVVAAETPVATTAPIADIIDAATKKVAEAAKVKAELKAQKEAEKAAAKKAKEDAKAAKEAEKVAKAEKAATISKNGVTRPRDGSACGKIWAICDAVSRQMQAPAPIAAVMEVAKENVDSNGVLSPLHPTTVRCQFAKWRKFNGVVAVKAEKVVPTTEAADAVIVDETVIVESAGDEVVA